MEKSGRKNVKLYCKKDIINFSDVHRKSFMKHKENFRYLFCGYIALNIFLFGLITQLTFKSNNEKILTSSEISLTNLFLNEKITKDSSGFSGNSISSISSFEDSLVIVGDGALLINASELKLKPHKQYKISAECDLINTVYRSYCTILLKNSNWELANSNNVTWQKNSPQNIALNFTWDINKDESYLYLRGYDRYGLNKISDKPLIWKVSKLMVSEVISDSDKNYAKLRFYAYTSLLFGLGAILTLFIYKSKNLLNFSIAQDKFEYAVLILSGLLILLAIGVINSFPIEALRLRADAWSYDIVARSLYEGFGFRAYNSPELTSYPLVPIYYAFIYQLFGVGTTSVFWGNMIIVFLIWISICFCNIKFNPIYAFISLAVMSLNVPLWVSITWTMPELLSTLILAVVAIISSVLIYNEKKLYLKSILLGISIGIAALIRTDFYALMILLALYFFVRKNYLSAFKISAVSIISLLILVSPWWIYQYNNVQSNVVDVFWESDLGRVEKVFEKIYKRQNLRGDQSVSEVEYFLNLKKMTLKPYREYFDISAPKHKYPKFVHHLTLILTIFGVLTIFLKGDRKIFYGLPEICILIELSRTLVLGFLHDSPRYFSHHFAINTIILCFCLSYFFRKIRIGKHE